MRLYETKLSESESVEAYLDKMEWIFGQLAFEDIVLEEHLKMCMVLYGMAEQYKTLVQNTITRISLFKDPSYNFRVLKEELLLWAVKTPTEAPCAERIQGSRRSGKDASNYLLYVLSLLQHL